MHEHTNKNKYLDDYDLLSTPIPVRVQLNNNLVRSRLNYFACRFDFYSHAIRVDLDLSAILKFL